MPNMNPGITPAQGRVLYHMERLFRSAGGNGQKAHTRFVLLCEQSGLPKMVDQYTTWQCVLALQLIERACGHEKMHHFRPIATGWRDFVPARRISCGCCTRGCVCQNHMDIPRGLPPRVCGLHTDDTDDGGPYDPTRSGGLYEPLTD